MDWFLALILPLLLISWFLVGLAHAASRRWRHRINARADLYPGSARHQQALEGMSLAQYRLLPTEEQAALDAERLWADANAVAWRASWDEAQHRVELLRLIQDHTTATAAPPPPPVAAKSKED
ncbi:hypothetical protein [Streptomyces sp. NPDC058657]|uniref:hypothetical protein n=1 Tax=unclassified Streptomyces TaxID=2593676 RepID=UPI0036612FA1